MRRSSSGRWSRRLSRTKRGRPRGRRRRRRTADNERARWQRGVARERWRRAAVEGRRREQSAVDRERLRNREASGRRDQAGVTGVGGWRRRHLHWERRRRRRITQIGGRPTAGSTNRSRSGRPSERRWREGAERWAHDDREPTRVLQRKRGQHVPVVLNRDRQASRGWRGRLLDPQAGKNEPGGRPGSARRSGLGVAGKGKLARIAERSEVCPVVSDDRRRRRAFAARACESHCPGFRRSRNDERGARRLRVFGLRAAGARAGAGVRLRAAARDGRGRCHKRQED
jgi:hypothetical protein